MTKIEEPKKKSKKKQRPVIGWREWVGLPDLHVKSIKAKVDTGAKTSSLHAFNMEYFRRGKKYWVEFTIHPEQRSSKKHKRVQSEVFEFRKVKSSNGQSELRPVIMTNLQLMDQVWPIELTLTNRDEMGFRMLLGRQSFKGRFLVDVSSSYFGEKAHKKSQKKNT